MVAATRPELFGPIIVAGSPLSYWAGVRRQEPDALHRRAAGRQLADRARRRPRRRHLRRRLTWSRTSRTSIRPTRSGPSTTTSGPRSTPRGRASSSSRSGGAAMSCSTPRRCSGSSTTCSSATGSPRPRSSPATGCGSICATSARRSSASAPRATTSRRRSRRWAGSSTSTAATTTSAPTARPSSTRVHETVGHLGIFVSGGVATKEHEEFASNIDLIDVLPPGLYEAVMTPKSAEASPIAEAGRRRLDRALRAAHARRHPRHRPARSRGRAPLRRRAAGLGDQPRPLPRPWSSPSSGGDDDQSAEWLQEAAIRPAAASRCSRTATR